MHYAIVGICMIVGCSAAAGADQVWTELRAIGPTQTLTYSTCSPEECFDEGITRALGCSTTGGDGFFEMAAREDSLQIVNAVAGLEAMKPSVTLVIGEEDTAVTVGEMTLSHNDMDGGWNVQLKGHQFSDLFTAIAESDLSKPVRILVSRAEFELNPSREDANRLKALAMLCDPRG